VAVTPGGIGLCVNWGLDISPQTNIVHCHAVKDPSNIFSNQNHLLTHMIMMMHDIYTCQNVSTEVRFIDKNYVASEIK
jgi:hypothetical protein